MANRLRGNSSAEYQFQTPEQSRTEKGRMKRHRAKQFALPLADESFSLAVEETVDGERVTRERREREAAKQASDERQNGLALEREARL